MPVISLIIESFFSFFHSKLTPMVSITCWEWRMCNVLFFAREHQKLSQRVHHAEGMCFHVTHQQLQQTQMPSKNHKMFSLQNPKEIWIVDLHWEHFAYFFPKQLLRHFQMFVLFKQQLLWLNINIKCIFHLCTRMLSTMLNSSSEVALFLTAIC